MRRLIDRSDKDRVAPLRMAFLPGALQTPEDFVRAGFAAAVRARQVVADLEFLAPEFEHVTDRSVLERIRDDVVLPARAQGCDVVWLVGVSLGGLLALAYVERYAKDVDGICLLAPYLGNHIVLGEVARTGGVAGRGAGADDDELRIWDYVSRGLPESLAVHLGYGRADRFAAAHELLAARLAAGSVDVIEGGHEWPVWCALWERFLAQRLARVPPGQRGNGRG